MTRINHIQRRFLLILFFIVLLAWFLFFGGSRLAADFSVGPIDLTKIADGTYPGQAEIKPVRIRLEVKVQNQKITDIKIIEHVNGIGYRAEKRVTEQIIDQQTNLVDSVSGATISSRIIMKAVENAFSSSAEDP